MGRHGASAVTHTGPSSRVIFNQLDVRGHSDDAYKSWSTATDFYKTTPGKWVELVPSRPRHLGVLHFGRDSGMKNVLLSPDPGNQYKQWSGASCE
jgi:hypothetical protein